MNQTTEARTIKTTILLLLMLASLALTNCKSSERIKAKQAKSQ